MTLHIQELERRGEQGGDSNHPQPVKMASVLVVDDEPGIRSFLQRGLTKYFGLVETAEDVATAEDLRQRCHFDLIITDIRLPGAGRTMDDGNIFGCPDFI